MKVQVKFPHLRMNGCLPQSRLVTSEYCCYYVQLLLCQLILLQQGVLGLLHDGLLLTDGPLVDAIPDSVENSMTEKLVN